MAANTQNNAHAHDIYCPDPSAHQKNDGGLSAQASTAALYATQPQRNDVLNKDGKLSSKSAATSLKYAKPTDLPSFPSRGGDPNAAGAAAMLAKDYKMKDLWQPEQSQAGSKAALMAHKDGGKLDLWQYEGSKNGLSAAALAMRKNTQSPLSPTLDRGYTDAGKNNSLLAATKSTSSSRQRADSTPARPPPKYPDEQNSARNALNAATVSHRNSVRVPAATKEEGWMSEANQAARIKNSHMDKEMFGSAPPVEPEMEERKREAALRASAVSMAKKMYDHQNRARLAHPDDETSSMISAETAHRRNKSSMSQADLKEEAMKYITLQDQANKLAQERLAKVDKDMENSKYREYYGYGDKSPRKSRLSMRGRSRRRAASEGAGSDNSDDEEQARRIRRQMSQLNSASSNVTDKQRDEDRARLLKAAEKRVHDRMHTMDEKVFLDTGKPTQAMMDEWETKAREKAEKDRAEREKHPGKMHIGGGKYMDQSEIEAIAAARLKPTLDELEDNATKRREREAEIERRRDLAETERMEQKMRDDQQKAEFKRIKEQDKAAAKKEKEDRKAAQREEKARKSEDKRKSREVKRDAAAATAGGVAAGEAANKTSHDEEQPSEPQQDNKEKRKSLFGRFTDKFKKDEKPAGQSTETDDKTADSNTKEESHDASNNAISSAAGVGAIPTASTGEDDSLYNISTKDAEGAREVEGADDNKSSSSDEWNRDEEDSHTGGKASAAAGAAGVGGLAAYGLSQRDDTADDEKDTSGDVEDPKRLQAERAHSGMPLQSPAIEHKPNLERHISKIDYSSGEEADSEDLSDSDDDGDTTRRPQGQGSFLAAAKSDPSSSAAAEPADDSRTEENADKERVPMPVLSPPPKEKEDETTPATQQAAQPELAQPNKQNDPAAWAPVVPGGPSATESKTTSTEKPKDSEKPKTETDEKEKRGFRGLISRLKGRDKDGKSEGKLHKNRASSEQQPADKGFQGGAKFTSPPKKSESGSDGNTTAVTSSTSAAAAGTGTGTIDPNDDKPLPLHMGTDGPIGDPSGRVSSVSKTGEGEEGTTPGSPTSASSFKRHDAALRDPDEVSSSGAEEEDVQRGRGGRFGRKLGLSTGGKKEEEQRTPTVTTTSPGGGEGRESEEQFEEARDTFDESLAPPPPAGQAKSQSPVRETKFTEEL